jgi:hypothetical protein
MVARDDVIRLLPEKLGNGGIHIKSFEHSCVASVTASVGLSGQIGREASEAARRECDDRNLGYRTALGIGVFGPRYEKVNARGAYLSGSFESA